MSSLPIIPEQWQDFFRLYEAGDWKGWISNRYDFAEADTLLSDPMKMFEEASVVRWHKNQRNKLAEVLWPSSCCLKGDSSSDTGNGKHSAKHTIVLKSYQASTFYNSLRLKLGVPRAIRHWNNVWLLNQKGIQTPQPVFIALPCKPGDGQGLIAVETVGPHRRIREILTRELEADTLLNIAGHSVEAAKFAGYCGKYARQIHDRNLVHRDFSGANILIPDDWDGSDDNLCAQFVLLDINRIRKVAPGKMTMNLRIQDLERLFMPESLLVSYYSAYAGEDSGIADHRQKFLKYRRGYRRIRETRNPVERAFLKTFTYWPRTG
jgi:hypothetical protein